MSYIYLVIIRNDKNDSQGYLHWLNNYNFLIVIAQTSSNMLSWCDGPNNPLFVEKVSKLSVVKSKKSLWNPRSSSSAIPKPSPSKFPLTKYSEVSKSLSSPALADSFESSCFDGRTICVGIIYYILYKLHCFFTKMFL